MSPSYLLLVRDTTPEVYETISADQRRELQLMAAVASGAAARMQVRISSSRWRTCGGSVAVQASMLDAAGRRSPRIDSGRG